MDFSPLIAEFAERHGIANLVAEDNAAAIALEGGNFDVQKMNTGLAGFKTGGVSSIPERLGGQKYRDLHSGGSKFVGV